MPAPRAALFGLLCVCVSFAGCLGPAADGGDPAAEGPAGEAAPGQGAESGPPEPGLPPGAVEAPVLRHGSAFTFSASGVYDHVPEFTIVVVNQTDGTQLLAMSRQEELVDVIVWWNGYNGVLDGELNPLYPGQEGRDANFDFPLYDGKSWQRGEQLVTVRARDVATPFGSRPGFELRTERENGFRAWEYVPEIGFITSLHGELDGVVYRELRLERIGTATEWAWFVPGERFERTGATSPLEPIPFEVAEGYDAVAVSVGFNGPGRVVVVPAQGAGAAAPWTAESGGASGETWQGRLLPATPGRWSAVSQDPPGGGFAWIAAVAVTWTGP